MMMIALVVGALVWRGASPLAPSVAAKQGGPKAVASSVGEAVAKQGGPKAVASSSTVEAAAAAKDGGPKASSSSSSWSSSWSSSSIEEAVAAAVAAHAPALVACLRGGDEAVFVTDGVLGESTCRALRREAEACRAVGLMEIAASSGDVRSTIVSAGEAPLLRGYAEAVAASLEATFKGEVTARGFTHKLAVAELPGAAYARHVDTRRQGGAEDRRRLTAIYYLNPDYRAANGGSFRAYRGALEEAAPFAAVEPRGDRLVVFWADKLVHDVAASHGTGQGDHRWAITVWLRARDGADLSAFDPDVEDFHFGRGALERHLRDAAEAASSLLLSSSSKSANNAAAAAAAAAAAYFEVGECYFHGRGRVVRDARLAAEWYLKAARLGHAKAAFNLGCAATDGDGVDGDAKAAARWFRAAAQGGHPRAAYNLACLLDVAGAAEEARAWCQKAADSGYGPAQADHGLRCPDRADQLKYLRLAARQSHEPAYRPLADLLLLKEDD